MNDDILYQLKKPYFKKKSYISESKKELNVNLNDIKINNINKISNNSNALKLNIYINKNNIKTFKNIDDKLLLILKKKNKNWFNNNLNDDELIELFNYSFCSQTNTIEAILSNKSTITYNNENMEINTELINILEKNKNFINITVSHIGLYIFKEKIQNKWLIKNISIIDNTIINDFAINKEEIDKEWENTLKDTITNLNELVDKYDRNKIKINNFMDINLDLIKEIKNIKNTDKNWENKISILKNNIKNILSINDNR